MVRKIFAFLVCTLIVSPVFAFLATAITMFVTPLGQGKFISTADGSRGPAFYMFQKIYVVFLVVFVAYFIYHVFFRNKVEVAQPK